MVRSASGRILAQPLPRSYAVLELVGDPDARAVLISPSCVLAKRSDVLTQPWVLLAQRRQALLVAAESIEHQTAALSQRRRVLPRTLQRLLVRGLFNIAVGKGQQRHQVNPELATQQQRHDRHLMTGAIAR